MQNNAPTFTTNARKALADSQLQDALSGLRTGLVAARTQATNALPEYDRIRADGTALRTHTLTNLDAYLEAYEANCVARGGHVHWALDGGEACNIIADICKRANAKLIAKGKSMVSEEIGLNAHLEAHGLTVVETDLGEYILQLRHETPSHIIAPAIHLKPEQIAADFKQHHHAYPADRALDTPQSMVDEARAIMRQTYLNADVGITGANFLVAETGSSIIVTNEGNGDLTQALPRVHIVIASIDKVVPTLNDATTLLRLLARSATGQDTTAYTTFATGPKRADDSDGPVDYHVVILDNGRADLLASEFSEVLRCIRCGACMNHCPVYNAVGGHAYGWVYPGPIGAVMTPALTGIETAAALPNASTFCGRCEAVCPMAIPLPDLMRRWRNREAAQNISSRRARWTIKAWAAVASRPTLYHLAMKFPVAVLGALGRRRGHFSWLPFASAWTDSRDFPAPEGRTFQQLWVEAERGVPRSHTHERRSVEDSLETSNRS